MKWTRRQLLCGGAATAAIGLSHCLRRSTQSVISTGTENVAPRVAPPPKARTKARLILSHGSTRTKAVTSALDQTGILAGVRRGDTVLLKVNTNSGDAAPYSTSPEMVRVVAERLRDHGAKVIVGDRSFWGDPDTRGNLEKNGIGPAARRSGAELISFDDDIDWIQIPEGLVPNWRGPIRVPRLVRDSDLVINLPCVKTHFITGFTMALKNLLGLVHARDRARPGNLRTHEQGRIYKQIADINRFVKPDLNLLDGFQALVSGGPTPMSGATPTIASPRIIIASSDVVATDVVGLALLRTLCPDSERVAQMSCWDNPMISAAVSAENGIKGPDGLELIGEGVPNLLQIEQLVF